MNCEGYNKCYFINDVCKTDMDISYLKNFKEKTTWETFTPLGI